MPVKEEKVSHCWEMRGCDDEMQERCPHNTPGEPCPVCGSRTHPQPEAHEDAPDEAQLTALRREEEALRA